MSVGDVGGTVPHAGRKPETSLCVGAYSSHVSTTVRW